MTITKIPPEGLQDVATAGSKGSATEIPVVTINSKGQVTSLGGAALDLSTKANTDGSNASGTWPINISGNAATVPWSGVSGRPTALNQFTNNLGNYGNFITGGGGGVSGFAPGNNVGSVYMYQSGTGLYLAGGGNCNCYCC